MDLNFIYQAKLGIIRHDDSNKRFDRERHAARDARLELNDFSALPAGSKASSESLKSWRIMLCSSQSV